MPEIEFEVRFPIDMQSERLHPRPVAMPIVSSVEGDDKPLTVRLTSRAWNRSGNPLWERLERFEFTEPDDGDGSYEVAFVKLYDVPIGFGVLEVWTEDETGQYHAEQKTMNVMVYPDIRCKNDGTRWWLVRPTKRADPSSEMSHDPREAQESIITQIAPRTGTFHIPAALWKQSDEYFEGERYNPAGITGYNVQSAGLSVDDSLVREEEDGNVYCRPGEGKPGGEGVCGLPEHETRRIELIELEPVEVKAAAPATVLLGRGGGEGEQ